MFHEGVMCEGVMCEGVMCEGEMCEGEMCVVRHSRGRAVGERFLPLFAGSSATVNSIESAFGLTVDSFCRRRANDLPAQKSSSPRPPPRPPPCSPPALRPALRPAPPAHLKLLLVASLPLGTIALQVLQFLLEVAGPDGSVPTAVELSQGIVDEHKLGLQR